MTMVKYTTKEKDLFEEIASPLLHFMMPSVDRGSNYSNPDFLRGRRDHTAPAAESWMSIRGQHHASTSPIREFQIPDLATIDGPSLIGESHAARTIRSPSAGRKSNDKAE